IVDFVLRVRGLRVVRRPLAGRCSSKLIELPHVLEPQSSHQAFLEARQLSLLSFHKRDCVSVTKTRRRAATHLLAVLLSGRGSAGLESRPYPFFKTPSLTSPCGRRSPEFPAVQRGCSNRL